MIIERYENQNNETVAVSPSPARVGLDRVLANLYSPIADDLVRAEDILRAELASKIDFVEELTGRVRLYAGKRVRPALLLLAGKAAGRVTHEHHVLAAVVEMIHAASLVHDDVLDDAEIRRHVPTVNAEWGTEASILLGDYLFTHSFHLSASLESTLACRLIGQSTNRVCEGELHQVSRRGNFELTLDEYYSMIDGKTAELIACCTRLGAHFAVGQGEVEIALERFGRQVGLAFQIADDLLDLESEESSTGKSVGTDLEKQKMTLPLIRLRESASKQVRAELQSAYECSDGSGRRKILELLRASDALQFTHETALQHAEEAVRCLDILPASPAKDSLILIARLSAKRSA